MACLGLIHLNGVVTMHFSKVFYRVCHISGSRGALRNAPRKVGVGIGYIDKPVLNLVHGEHWNSSRTVGRTPSSQVNAWYSARFDSRVGIEGFGKPNFCELRCLDLESSSAAHVPALARTHSLPVSKLLLHVHCQFCHAAISLQIFKTRTPQSASGSNLHTQHRDGKLLTSDH
jgi:hypothetical protein